MFIFSEGHHPVNWKSDQKSDILCDAGLPTEFSLTLTFSSIYTVGAELTDLNAPFLLWLFYDSEAWPGAPLKLLCQGLTSAGSLPSPAEPHVADVSKWSQQSFPTPQTFQGFYREGKKQLSASFYNNNHYVSSDKTILLVYSALWSSKNGKNWMMIPQFREMVKKWKTSNSGIPNTPLKKRGRAIDIDWKVVQDILLSCKKSKWIFKAASQ